MHIIEEFHEGTECNPWSSLLPCSLGKTVELGFHQTLEPESSELCGAEACMVVVAVPDPSFAVVDSHSLFYCDHFQVNVLNFY